jgi:hypothetical protein
MGFGGVVREVFSEKGRCVVLEWIVRKWRVGELGRGNLGCM